MIGSWFFEQVLSTQRKTWISCPREPGRGSATETPTLCSPTRNCSLGISWIIECLAKISKLGIRLMSTMMGIFQCRALIVLSLQPTNLTLISGPSTIMIGRADDKILPKNEVRFGAWLGWTWGLHCELMLLLPKVVFLLPYHVFFVNSRPKIQG